MDNTRLFRAVYENSADGVMVADSARLIRGFNPAMERITGWRADEVIGTPCFEVLKLRDSRRADVCADRCPWLMNNWADFNVQGSITGKSGRPVEVSIRYAYAPAPSGGGAMVASVRDLTRFVEIEALEASLLAGVSHELQTPIAIIKAYASTLARPDVRWDNDIIREKLLAIEGESDRLSQMVTKLLFTSRLDGGEIKLNKMAIDLDAEVKRIARRFTDLTDRHTIVIDFPVEFPWVAGDPERIEEVLSNLIENAIKFSPDGGRITITGNVAKDDVLVSVQDAGIGIWPETAENLFERFYRAEADAVRTTPGTGLGLYICRSLIEAHGGQISAEGNPGAGACFTFSLPLAGKAQVDGG